jgi:hypothetical protein
MTGSMRFSPDDPPAMVKHVAVFIAMLLAFAVSIVNMGRFIGFASPWMVLLVFLCFLGLAKFAEPFYRLKLPQALRAVRPWELRGSLYRRLGVPAFGWMLRNTPLKALNNTVYVSRERRDPSAISRQVESAEAIHFWAALLLVPYLAVCLLSGRWSVLLAFLAVQVLGNAYPMMHLRSVRGRLDRISRRAAAA